MILTILSFFVIVVTGFMLWMGKKRNMDRWFVTYLKSSPNTLDDSTVYNIYFAITDHFEPFQGQSDKESALRRVKKWVDLYPEIAQQFKDSAGRSPVHTMFYPIEEYDEHVMDIVSQLKKEQYADVEIHLHHDNDNSENLKHEINNFKETLYNKHNLLRKENGVIKYGFIHGNWALNNCRPDGKWCGVDDEIQILRETGCYADFTMPSAPDVTQTEYINGIYLLDNNLSDVTLINETTEIQDKLVMVQGPLALNWKYRKSGLVPKIENGEISHDNIWHPSRGKLWLKYSPCIQNNGGKNIFIKLYTHGAQDENIDCLLIEKELAKIWTFFNQIVGNHPNYNLFYVSAWEMYLKILESLDKND
ncbi:MAG: hypothetical protein Kow00108_00420 [Calditrichia bacterium]